MRISNLLLSLALSLPVGAQAPFLVKDINTTYSTDIGSSSPAQFISYRGKIFFVATLDDSGTELWSTDGTAAGTTMVADLIPGPGSSSPSGLQILNNLLLFGARNVNNGIELWASDGTEGGAHLLVDINPGPSSSQPSLLPFRGDQMLLIADNGSNGRELWITDGTAAGTHMVKDINPGPASSAISYYAVVGRNAYFSVTGALWKTDGTESGTVKVTDVVLRNLTATAGRLYFQGKTADNGWEPWVSDGTAAGTQMISDIRPGSSGSLDGAYSFVNHFTPLNDGVLFVADDGVHGKEMWISDGTAGGTHLVRDLADGNQSMWPDGFVHTAVLGKRAYFTAFDEDHGWELWVTDGTESGTTLFADLTPGVPSTSPTPLGVTGARLFFVAGYDSTLGENLWVTDGTVDGTHMLGETVPVGFRSGFSLVDGKIYFEGFTRLNGGEPWVSDGTDAGTRMIANLAGDEAPSSSPMLLAGAGKYVFFYAQDYTQVPTSSEEPSLWRSDGTSGGTIKLVDRVEHPDALITAGPLVFFRPKRTSFDLQMSDGTPEGTQPAESFFRRFGDGRPVWFFPLGDALLTSVSDGFQSSLWRTTAALDAPATELGTRDPSRPTEAIGRCFFFADGPRVASYALWTTDGTPAGTQPIVPDLGNTDTWPFDLVNAAGTLFYLKSLRDEDITLWKSDGSFDGTVAVKSVPSLPGYHTQIRAAGRRVFLLADRELWTSDGTAAGTLRLAEIETFDIQRNPFTAVGDRIVFTQYQNDTGYELWGSDGTKEGTTLLQQIGHRTFDVVTIDGKAYFAGSDDDHGVELWTTDGTVEGTSLLVDLNSGFGSSRPSGFTKVGDLLYFSAYTDATGEELWALPMTEPALSISDARVTEGDTSPTTMRFSVSLTPAAAQTVAVHYSTSDGTARSGDDYDASSGILVFEPSETAKTIDIPVHGDLIPEDNETLYVTLSDAGDVRLIKREATGIVDDNDASADLDVTPNTTTDQVYGTLRVSNKGPRAATGIDVRITSTPSSGTGSLNFPLPQIAAGTSALVYGGAGFSYEQLYLSATVTSHQRDPEESDNSTVWTMGSYQLIGMDAGYLTPGATAMATAELAFKQNPAIQSSDPAVIPVPSTVTKVSESFVTFPIQALKPGSSTISIDGQAGELTVTVLAPGTRPRWPGGMSMTVSPSSTWFDLPVTVTAKASGRAPLTAAAATGTITVTAGGHELARTNIEDPEEVKLSVYLPALGSVTYQIAYDGDENFLPQTVDGIVNVKKGKVTMIGDLKRTDVVGTYSLKVKATGSPVAPPTGTVSIVDGSNEIARMTLSPASSGTSYAETVLSNLGASPTLTLRYLGDALYEPGSQQTRVTGSRRRSVRK